MRTVLCEYAGCCNAAISYTCVHAAYCVLDWVGVVWPCSNGWDEELLG